MLGDAMYRALETQQDKLKENKYVVFEREARTSFILLTHEFEREARECRLYHSPMEYHSNAHSNTNTTRT